MGERRSARWAADVSSWAEDSADWARALALLPAHEAQQVARFVFAKDRRLALASRLLQRALVRALFGVPWRAVDLARTPENKPFWRRTRARPEPPPTWNFNASHHGSLAAIACDARALVGVDVVRTSERPRGTSAAGFFRAFVGHFTAAEWAIIRQESDEDAQFARFYRLWSLKEAYIKAVGIGLGFKLQRAEFSEDERGWRLRLDGRDARDWTFECVEIDGDHVISVALGPVLDMWQSQMIGEEDASSIFPIPTAELADLQAGRDCDEDESPSEWRMLSLAELIAYAEDEPGAGYTG